MKLANEGKEQGVPVEKIRQKLVLEGLEPDLINVVLKGSGAGGDVGPEEHIEPSSPSTSPQRRQLSARWEGGIGGLNDLFGCRVCSRWC